MKEIKNYPEFEIEIIEQDSETISLSQADDIIAINKDSIKELVDKLVEFMQK